MHEAVIVPIAHVGHWLWVLYVPPILIVAASIVRTKVLEKRERQNRSTD